MLSIPLTANKAKPNANRATHKSVQFWTQSISPPTPIAICSEPPNVGRFLAKSVLAIEKPPVTINFAFRLFQTTAFFPKKLQPESNVIRKGQLLHTAHSVLTNCLYVVVILNVQVTQYLLACVNTQPSCADLLINSKYRLSRNI